MDRAQKTQICKKLDFIPFTSWEEFIFLMAASINHMIVLPYSLSQCLWNATFSEHIKIFLLHVKCSSLLFNPCSSRQSWPLSSVKDICERTWRPGLSSFWHPYSAHTLFSIPIFPKCSWPVFSHFGLVGFSCCFQNTQRLLECLLT